MQVIGRLIFRALNIHKTMSKLAWDLTSGIENDVSVEPEWVEKTRKLDWDVLWNHLYKGHPKTVPKTCMCFGRSFSEDCGPDAEIGMLQQMAGINPVNAWKEFENSESYQETCKIPAYPYGMFPKRDNRASEFEMFIRVCVKAIPESFSQSGGYLYMKIMWNRGQLMSPLKQIEITGDRWEFA